MTTIFSGFLSHIPWPGSLSPETHLQLPPKQLNEWLGKSLPPDEQDQLNRLLENVNPIEQSGHFTITPKTFKSSSAIIKGIADNSLPLSLASSPVVALNTSFTGLPFPAAPSGIPSESILPSFLNPSNILSFIQKGTIPKEAALTKASIGSLSNVITTTSKGLFAFIPFFLFALYSSKKKILQNINVQLTATSQPKIFKIGFGKKNDHELSVIFEAEAGRPIRFLQEKVAATAKHTGKAANVIFNSDSFWSRIPVLNHFILGRKEIRTECIITINDPLAQEANSIYIPLSKQEGFTIRTKPMHIHKQDFEHSVNDRIVNVSKSPYARLGSLTVNVTPPISGAKKHRTQEFSLPFEGSGQPYLTITQY